MTKTAKPKPRGPVPRATARVRVVFAAQRWIGPGKADLLEAIGRTGSISAAGRELGMSYRRAWLLVDSVNGLFTRPVVVTSTGGAHGGGAQLTDFGCALVAAYRRVEERTHAVIREEFAPFESDLAPDLAGPPPITAQHHRRISKPSASKTRTAAGADR